MVQKSNISFEHMKDKLLDQLISCEIGSYTCSYAPDKAVITISNLCALTGLTKYGARKALKSLIADRLVEYTSQGCPAVESYNGEYRELVYDARPPINGYCLTKYGMKSERFKKAYNDWCDSLEEWANGRE